jgi:hypothetical protein
MQKNMNSKTLVLFLSLLLLPIIAFADDTESARPTFGVKIERNVDIAIIEGETYLNVVVEFNAAAIDDIFKEGVKITVKDSNGKKIYKKRFSNSYLYGFSSGAIQVGKGNVLTQVILCKSSSTGKWCMELREKGIY